MSERRAQYHRNKERNRWETRVSYIDESGTKKRKKLTATTQAELKQRVEDFRERLDLGLDSSNADPTVAEFLATWLEKLELRGDLSPKTIELYGQCSRNYVVPALGSIHLSKLAPTHVDRMVDRMLAGTLPTPSGKKTVKSKRTCQLAQRTLGAALQFALRDGLVKRNVARLALPVRVDDRKEGRTLTIEQAGTFLTHIQGHQHEAAWVVMLTFGLRLGELLGLEWDNVDLEKRRLSVRSTIKRVEGVGLIFGEPKTVKSKRTVMLPPSVITSLKKHRVAQSKERLKFGEGWPTQPLGADLVFRTSTGTAVDPRNFRDATYRATDSAGLGRWSPHELRHSAASIMLAQGLSIELIADVLGHSSPRVTQEVYAHLMDNAREEVAVAMEQALWG